MNQKASMSEQRRNSRVQRQFAAMLKRADNGATATAIIEDISANGLKIAMDDSDFVDKDQEIEVLFECEEVQMDDLVTLKVIVRGKWADGKGTTFLGVQGCPGDNGLERLEETWLALMFDEIHKDDDVSYF